MVRIQPSTLSGDQMEEELRRLHLKAGEVAGRDKTCGKKHAYLTEEVAQKAANNHNKWKERRHDVEPYPCAFCKQWHIGGVMSVRVLETIAKRYQSR